MGLSTEHTPCDLHIPTTGFEPNPMTGNTDQADGTATFPNGLIIKWGKVTRSALNTPVVFGTEFPNACLQAFGCGGVDNESFDVTTHTLATTGFQIRAADAGHTILRWFAVGR